MVVFPVGFVYDIGYCSGALVVGDSSGSFGTSIIYTVKPGGRARERGIHIYIYIYLSLYIYIYII